MPEDFTGRRVLVAGFGVSGFAAADNLTHVGASVIAVDEAADPEREEKAELLRILGADIRLGPGSTLNLPEGIDLVVVSPGWRPDHPLIEQAMDAGVEIWGDIELAWRLRDPDTAAPWLAVTGTNGKTTVVQMLTAILQAAGLRAVACGNVGLSAVEVVMDPQPYDVLVVELSSFQLHWVHTMTATSAAVLNVAEDHIDWHGTLADYAAAKGRVYQGNRLACVYNVEDPLTEQLVRDADVVEGARAIGFTTGLPGPGMLGVVEGILVDRAFVPDRHNTAAELLPVDRLALPAPHFVANALAAAALARSVDVPPAVIAEALAAFVPDGHRIAEVGIRDEVRWVDDSKATNPPAALASIQSFESVVWIAGGLAKGATFDDLVRAARDRLRAAVLLGADADLIAGSLARHAPDVPVFRLPEGETDPMDWVVAQAATLAVPGDTVLLAPGCASMDMFENYAARGDAFVAAVQEHWRR